MYPSTVYGEVSMGPEKRAQQYMAHGACALQSVLELVAEAP